MEDTCRVRAFQGVTRDFPQPNLVYASSINQFEMNPGQFAHPFVQQEVCVIERTIRQEPVGTSLRSFGLQDSNINSVRGDVGNSLLALVSGSHLQACSNYQQQTSSLRSTFTSSNLQAYQIGSSKGLGNWPVHPPTASGGTCVGGVVPEHGVETLSAHGRELNLSILGRDLNLSQYTRIAGGQERLASSLVRASGVAKQNDRPECANDTSGSGSFPQWLTDRGQRQRGQHIQSPVTASGVSFPRVAETSRAVSTSTNSAPIFSCSTARVPWAVCINYTTGQKFGGELRLTRSGFIGVVCSCHGFLMSVVKFTEHSGIYCSNPGGAVHLDDTGENLVQWRRTLYSEYGVKIPDDSQGWDWSEGEDMELGHMNRKAMFAQSCQKEVDLSCSNPTMKSRVTHAWDSSMLPGSSNSFTSAPALTNMGFSSNYNDQAIQDPRERVLKSFGKDFGINSVEFGSCTQSREQFDDTLNRGSSTLQSLQIPSRLEPTSSAEFFNFISGTQVMSGHSEQLAVERRVAVGTGGMMKGANITWNDRVESSQHEKDNCHSGIELRLGQPSQHSQPVGPSLSATTLANQMHRVLWQTGKSQNMSGATTTSASELPSFTGHQMPFNNCNFDRLNGQMPSFTGPGHHHHSTSNGPSERGVGGSSSGLVSPAIFENVSALRSSENMRNERQNFIGEVGGVRWESTTRRGFRSRDEAVLNSEQTSKHWDDESQRIAVSSVRSGSHGQQDLDTILCQLWDPKGCHRQHQPVTFGDATEGRVNRDGRGQNVTHSHGNCAFVKEAKGTGQDHPFREGDGYESSRCGQGCVCSIAGNSSCGTVVGRASTMLGDIRDCHKMDLEADGRRRGLTRDNGEGSSAHECSSSGVRRLKTFPAIVSQGCVCSVSGPENPIHGSGCAPSGEHALAPCSALETGSEITKKLSNLEDETPRPGVKEPKIDTNQWKEVGGGFVHGSGTVQDLRHSNASPVRVDLEEDILADTATKAPSPVRVSSRDSDLQQPVSEVSSKSSENITSEVSGATATELSNIQDGDKIPIDSEVVDEGSGIGKCSSSDGADMGIVDMGSMPNLNLSCKDDAQKLASRSSNGHPTLCNAEECSARSAEGHQLKESGRDEIKEDVHDAVKSKKKRLRVLKCKRVEGLTGNGDAKRQKMSALGNITRNLNLISKRKAGSDVSSSGGHNPSTELSPSNRGAAGIMKAQKLSLDAPDHDAPMNFKDGSDHLASSSDRAPKQKETLVIRVPQGLNRKKAKRSGRCRPVRKRMGEVLHSEAPGNVASPAEVNIPSPTFDSVHVESDVTGSFIPESVAWSSGSGPNHLLKSQGQPVIKGRVTLGRPSPCSATRMMSLNAIMRRSEADGKASFSSDKPVLPTIRGKPRANANNAESDSLILESGLKETSSKNLMKRVSSSKGSEFTEKADAKSSSLRARVKVSSLKEESKRSLQNLLNQGIRPGDQIFRSCSRKGPKLTLLKHESKLYCKVDGKEAHTDNGLTVSSTCDLEPSSSRSGSNALPIKQDLTLVSASIVKGPPVRSVINGGSTKTRSSLSTVNKSMKSCAPMSSVLKDNSRAVARRSFTPSAVDVFRAPTFQKAETDAPPPVVNVAIQSRVSGERLKRVSVEDHVEAADTRHSHKILFKPSALASGLSVKGWNHRSKRSVFKGAPKVPFHPKTQKYGPNFTDVQNVLDRAVPLDSLKRKSKANVQNAHASALSQDNGDKSKAISVSAAANSIAVRGPYKQDSQKVRSLHEITAESTLLKSNTGVFDFHDDSLEHLEINGNDSSSGQCTTSGVPFTVPVYFSDGKCLIPQGERSPRPKFAKVNTIWQRKTAANLLRADPVEIIVEHGNGLKDRLMPSSARRPAQKKEDVSRAELQPVVTSVVQQKETDKVDAQITSSAGPLPCSSAGLNDILEVRLDDCSRKSSKRSLKHVEKSESVPKKQKLLGESVPSFPRDAFDIVKDSKIEFQIPDDGINISGRKRRCSRQKRFLRRVPEGVVECCVCNSSVSEFCNQIVCCSRCPVKVHQACYGIKKVPNRDWFCRTCKATSVYPVCVLCGYGGGAMTRAQKAKGFVKSLANLWHEKENPKEKAHPVPLESVHVLQRTFKDSQQPDETNLQHECSKNRLDNWYRMDHGPPCTYGGRASSGMEPSPAIHPRNSKHETMKEEIPGLSSNTITLGVMDASVVQWVHMVCALWMPGTRCLNFNTMGVFDVSGVAHARRKLICSVCHRKGGACIQCRVDKCGIPFHAWCAHEKGLLQSEIVEDGSDQVGFYGKCIHHGNSGDSLVDTRHVPDNAFEVSGVGVGPSTCARTEGYKGKLTLEQRALNRRQAQRSGSAAVTPEQVAAWLKINERKTCKSSRDQKLDHREYENESTRRLSVYKSGIHGLGLYTAEFIGRNEMVVEYIGEIVGLRVADKREADYHSGKRMQYQGACYLFRIDKERIIDATRKGGIARFVNHSCSPNCVAKVICVKNKSKVVFYAQRDIYAGEEITYDYQFNFEQEGDKIPCFCGSAKCRGTLN